MPEFHLILTDYCSSRSSTNHSELFNNNFRQNVQANKQQVRDMVSLVIERSWCGVFMKPGNLNGSEEDAAKRRAEELAKESADGSFMTGMITFVVLALVVVAVFYGIVYFRTN